MYIQTQKHTGNPENKQRNYAHCQRLRVARIDLLLSIFRKRWKRNY